MAISVNEVLRDVKRELRKDKKNKKEYIKIDKKRSDAYAERIKKWEFTVEVLNRYLDK